MACEIREKATQAPLFDYADRLIAATALAEGIALVTQDAQIRSSPMLKTIW